MIVLKLGTSEGTLEYISYMEFRNVECKGWECGSVVEGSPGQRAFLAGGHKVLGSIRWTTHASICM